MPINNISLQRSILIGLVVLIILAIIAVIDFITGPTLNLTIVYFLPITYAAWSLGRAAAIAAALVAEVPTYVEQARLVDIGTQSITGATSTVIVRLLVYAFVATVTSSLVKSVRETRQTMDRLSKANEDLQYAYARLDEDAKAGGLLQANLLAFSPPIVPGCEVGVKAIYAQPVGGDFADAGIVNGYIYSCVGDISGKGTPAALFTTLLQHIFHTILRRGLRGRDVIIALNEEISQTLPSDRFVTLFYTEVNPTSGRVNYVNAGHPEGLVYRRKTGQLEAVGSTAPLLGSSIVRSRINSSLLRLYSGDVLVIYTDGATDSKTRDGTRLADDTMRRLILEYAHLNAQQVVDRICFDIVSMTEDTTRDDLTVLCIKKTPRPRK